MMVTEKILVVDSNLSHLKLIKLALAESGYDIHTAVSAEETMQVLQEFQPRLILMEIQLPGIDGLELVRRLKADPKYHNIIIIAVTAYNMKGDKEIGLNAGYDGYISKPIDMETFPQVVADYLKKKGTDTTKK